MSRLSFKELLAQAANVPIEQMETWQRKWRLATQGGSTDTLIDFICREAGVSEDTFLQSLAAALNWPFIDLRKVTIPTEARNKISTKVAFQYLALPTDCQNNALQVAVSNPFDNAMISAVQFDARMPVKFALATKAEIDKALKKYYGVGAETLDELQKDEDEPIELLVDKEITEGDQEASVIKFVNQIIWEAFKDRATDIHFEPAEDELRIRYRIDGILVAMPVPPSLSRYRDAIISRLKIMARLNISERRQPQDGRFSFRVGPNLVGAFFRCDHQHPQPGRRS